MYSQAEIAAAGLLDFRVFLRQVWDFLGLPVPTPIQNDIAKRLQHGPDRQVLEAFRGVGKSWITVAFVLWTLFLDPQKKILVVSANKELAADFAKFAKQLISGMPLLQHLKPRNELQKDSMIAFDVGPAAPSKDPSVKCAGINGQITGNRADLIVSDDVEVPKNSFTHTLRERLAELVKEYDAVLKPGGRVVYLGTPQNEASLYDRLPARGYTIMIWPVEIPAKLEPYHDRLAPFIMRMIEKGAKAGEPTDPIRFNRAEIDQRKASYGLSGFALQFMLDTNPSSVDQHPLKTRDLIVHDCDIDMGHVKLVWGSDGVVQDLHSCGFAGDYYVRPAWKSEEMATYTGTVMAIDPSGMGNDETAYAIVRNLHGVLYLVDVGGFRSGFAEETLKSLATRAVLHRVNNVITERNYGGGMFEQLLKPVMARVATDARLDTANPDPKARPPAFEEEYNTWSRGQKESRILDTLEPLIQSHKLVVDRKVIERDMIQQQDDLRYSFVHQLTRMCRVKGALAHEDRLEAVAMACQYFVDRVKIDADRVLESRREEEQRKLISRFFPMPGQSDYPIYNRIK